MSDKSEWMVSSNTINGRTMYGVFRIRNVKEINHSGNRENYGDYYDDRKLAETLAKQLNKEDVHGQE